jgi:hypothetical protein
MEEADGAVIRKMKIRNTLYREKSSVNDVRKEICRELLDHPLYSGKIVIKAVPSSVQNPMALVDLQFFLDLEPKFPQTESSITGGAEMGVSKGFEVRCVRARACNLAGETPALEGWPATG